MATARVPRPVGATLYEITIDSSGQADYPGLIIEPGDEIEFHNLASYPVNIQFICDNGPVFSDISKLDTGDTSTPQTPQISNITTDYHITNANTGVATETCSIEVQVTPSDEAPLLVPIGSGDPPDNMATVAIPQDGYIQFDLDASYNLSWSPADAFPTPSNPIGPGLSPVYQVQTGNQNGSSDYALSSTLGTVGGGTVKISS
jgi:hypothetical protein